MKDKDISISQEEYLEELVTMLQEAFEEACSNDIERIEFARKVTLLVTDPLLREKREIPKHSHELYANRKKRAELGGRKENPFEFLYRVYSDQLGNGLTRADIKMFDIQLYSALYKFRNSPKKPDNFDEMLPTAQGRRRDDVLSSSLKYAKKVRQRNNIANQKFRRTRDVSL